MLKKNLKVITAIFLITLITFSSITLLAKVGRALKLDLTEDRIYSLSDETGKIIINYADPHTPIVLLRPHAVGRIPAVGRDAGGATCRLAWIAKATHIASPSLARIA